MSSFILIEVHVSTNYPKLCNGTQHHLPVMRAAENLCCMMWGQRLETMLSSVLDHDRLPWECLRKAQLDRLGLEEFGYTESGLLIRTEYKIALDELCLKEAKHGRCRGAIIIGQPGIGKSTHWNLH